MLDTSEKRRTAAKWLIGIVTCCILIYLAFSHLTTLSATASWVMGMIEPLVIGAALAVIFNVPMRLVENLLSNKLKMRRGVRPLSIVLSLILVFGIFMGVIVLVIPEFASAITLLVQILIEEFGKLAQLQNDPEWMETSLGQAVSAIDWNGLSNQLQNLVKTYGGTWVNQAMGAAGTMIADVVSVFIGLIFAIYILSNKETLKQQTERLARAWLPEKLGSGLIHIADVCNVTFRNFITGQVTEAFILGTLCMIGMLILQIPYAPMVGALIGVTALIPIVGAFIGTIVGFIMIMTVDFWKAVIFVAFLLILQQIEGNLIYPKVVGSKVNLPAMWVLAAVTVGGNLGGAFGMILGVPVMSAAYALIREATQIQEQKKLVNSAVNDR